MKIFVTDLEGATHAIDAIEGWRVMEIIRDHGFPMKAECGGACACATCHVYVDEEWIGKVTPLNSEEDYMLDEAYDRRKNSRLSCQLIMNAELNGLRVTLGKND
ncbi:MAG TPA: 2Fe-2S iron-sulfur cluster-binding protein [Alphaproteobacteria bacterium]|jgi:2Fe-2S ferredoxin|nr:2Fe-2S iron-sulfur cluster binding domain-containing protein [Micavibrio sp.]MBK9562948.1 2Fe-2S iron-sulfur cluster binding domain-containing protein [Micavibrio sp.]HQX26729.1 2Fe-2S iron-sulfur cluster-binding protein [Alphaproteobacteria bacterium]